MNREIFLLNSTYVSCKYGIDGKEKWKDNTSLTKSPMRPRLSRRRFADINAQVAKEGFGPMILNRMAQKDFHGKMF